MDSSDELLYVFTILYPGKLTKVGATEVEESAVFISGAENSTAHQA